MMRCSLFYEENFSSYYLLFYSTIYTFYYFLCPSSFFQQVFSVMQKKKKVVVTKGTISKLLHRLLGFYPMLYIRPLQYFPSMKKRLTHVYKYRRFSCIYLRS